MKKQIRFGVFETNSSSTHSVSIYKRRIEFRDIPKDSEVVLDDTYYYGTDIFDEFGKLNFVVTMLASIIENKWDDEGLKIESFEDMINLDWFKWLAEVVKEESNTDVVYREPAWSHVPYYDTTYDEYNGIEKVFTGNDDEVMTNKDKFKERVKYIIYNHEVIIESKENEY